MDEFRSNDPYRETVREMSQAQARDMALTIKVRARKKIWFSSVVCNHMQCKTMLIWMG